MSTRGNEQQQWKISEALNSKTASWNASKFDMRLQHTKYEFSELGSVSPILVGRIEKLVVHLVQGVSKSNTDNGLPTFPKSTTQQPTVGFENC